MTTKLLLIDDHPLFRKGLASLIAMTPGFAVVGEASNRVEALSQVGALRPDLILLDLTLGTDSGLELLKDLRALHPEIKVLVLSMHDESVYAERALAAGARGYVQKQEASLRVMEAIRAVVQGRTWYSPEVRDKLLQNLFDGRTGPGTDGLSRLSDRELEVFTWMGRGLGSSKIAETLGLSVKTVDTHKEHLKQKLHCRDSQELRIRAAEWAARG